MNKSVLASVVAVSLAAVSARAATTIAQWNFETAASSNAIVTTATPGAGNPSGPVPADIDVPGGSVASGLHASNTTYSAPAGDVDLSLNTPATSPSLHSYSANQWTVGDYWQFQTSTLGFTGVTVAWDQAGSNTGPGNFSLYYSFGGPFTLLGGPYTIPLSTWNTATAGAASLSAAAGAVDNSATVIFRLVDNSTASVNGGTVGSGGTDRVDNFTVAGIPEPSTVLLVGAGLVSGLLVMRRRRS